MDKNILRKIRRNDRIAALTIRSGGMLVIASVVLILLLIGREALPLFSQPRATELSAVRPQTLAPVLAAGVDEYVALAYVIDGAGHFSLHDLTDGSLREQLTANGQDAQDVVQRAQPLVSEREHGYLLQWRSGLVTLEQLGFSQHHDAQARRQTRVRLTTLARFEAPADPAVAGPLAAANSESGAVLARLEANGDLLVDQQLRQRSLLGEERLQQVAHRLAQVHPDRLSCLALDRQGALLYAGTERGALLRWRLQGEQPPQLLDKIQAFADGRAITALALLQGDTALAVGDASGQVSVWFAVPSEEQGQRHLGHIRDLSRHDGPVRQLVPSPRDRTLLSLDDRGVMHLDYSTSERHLLSLQAGMPLVQAQLAPRGNALLALQADGRVRLWQLDNPHPQASFKALFGRVWYENYSEPAWVWQSSAASDDFEEKLSLTPLIFGTFKGTFYAMIFAVPLALLGALYTSQFGSHRLRELIKPSVEIMAAVPSVIIGFLAALWFAPLLERQFVGFVLAVLLIPLFFVLLLLAWQGLRRQHWARHIERGHEFLVLAPLLVLAVAVALQLGPLLEGWLFGGNFKQWLFEQAGLRYDARNSIVISFALGFAVIPIIFTMAEDSLSNVPTSLRAASLALGASRWQTVWRVVLPSASPGIFAAVMIGLGRAVGETMIVLMATGNTPIMDLSLFNGMRPLSANIAVEIPEAPHGGTLYRVLFLSAVLLFLLTFVLNTVAELVRQRLRRRYGRF